MTLPDNIKAEIEKAVTKVLQENVIYAKGNFYVPLCDLSTQFYERGLKELESLERKAFEAGREGGRPLVDSFTEGDGVTVQYVYGDWQEKYETFEDYKKQGGEG